MTATYDPALNSQRSWALSIRALREINIRKRRILPSPDRPDEQRWAEEGPRPNDQLDTVKEGG